MSKFILLPLAFLTLFACEKEDAITELSPWERGLDLEAPLVGCEDAFPGWEFSNLPAPQPQSIRDVSFLSREVGYAAGNQGYIGRTTDGAEHWARVGPGTTNASFQAVVAVNRDTIYAAGGREAWGTNFSPGAIMIKSTDGGESFTRLHLEGLYEVLDLHFFDGENGLALAKPRADTVPALIYRIAEGGASWTLIDSAASYRLREFAEVDDRLAAVGHSGMLVRQADTGAWEDRPFPLTFSGPPIFDGASVGLAAAREGTGFNQVLYRTEDGGRQWGPVAGPAPERDLAYLTPQGRGIIMNYRYEIIGGDVISPIGMHVYSSTDAGLTWDLLKVDGSCGVNGELWNIAPGVLMGIGPETFLLERRN